MRCDTWQQRIHFLRNEAQKSDMVGLEVNCTYALWGSPECRVTCAKVLLEVERAADRILASREYEQLPLFPNGSP
jgi:hypothetical protein